MPFLPDLLIGLRGDLFVKVLVLTFIISGRVIPYAERHDSSFYADMNKTMNSILENIKILQKMDAELRLVMRTHLSFIKDEFRKLNDQLNATHVRLDYIKEKIENPTEIVTTIGSKLKTHPEYVFAYMQEAVRYEAKKHFRSDSKLENHYRNQSLSLLFPLEKNQLFKTKRTNVPIEEGKLCHQCAKNWTVED